MTYGAKETAHVSVPHSHPVRWSCSRKGTLKTVSVEATYWIDARKEAARQLVCEPDQVLCVLDSPSEAAASPSVPAADESSRRVGHGAVASGGETDRKHLNGKAKH